MIAYLYGHAGEVLAYTLQHLRLSVTGVMLAALVALPLGVLLSRAPRVAGPVLTLVDIVQTIPSLALLALLMVFLGIGDRTLVAGLFLYSLLPLARNTFTGIRAVHPAWIEAAQGMGMTGLQVLLRVELPLAFPVILAGFRVALVTAIGITTIGVLFGAGGLGAVIIRGLQLAGAGTPMVLAGALPAAVLAIAVDALLGLGERLATRHLHAQTR